MKKNWLAESKQEEECKRIIEFYKTSKQKDIFNSNDAKNIQVKDLKTLYRYKYGKNPQGTLNKALLLQSWIAVKDQSGVAYEKTTWADEQEHKLKRLQEEEIKISDTEIGKQTSKILSEALAIIPHLTNTQMDKMKAALPAAAQDTPLAIEATVPDITIQDTPLAIEAATPPQDNPILKIEKEADQGEPLEEETI